ncbi:MAG: PorT family protein [Cyclobacteriaceae bacterium]|nr:PorT family protein [Cyclobacteriaceae bacterium]
MSVRKIFVGLLLSLCLALQGYAQDCETTLNKAVDEFNAGHFNNIAELLNGCIKRGFTREQRERAYLLLTQTYLLLDDPTGAENSYLSLLQANPEFVADEKRDPIDVVYLSKKFTSTPIFTWYLKIGGNTTPITVMNDYSVWNEGSRKYKLTPGFQFGGGLDWNYTDNLMLGAEFNLAFTGYKQTESGFNNGLDIKEISDRQSWMMIPIMAKYTLNSGKIRPYVYTGYSFNILFRDVNTITLINQEPSSGNGDAGQLTIFEDESPNLNYLDRRNKFNGAFLLGGGLKYKFGLDYLFGDIRLSYGMTNPVDPERRYADYRESPFSQGSAMEPITKYAHIEDDFRMHTIFVTVGYIHPLYKPRKLKNARTKSVFRKIGKQQR